MYIRAQVEATRLETPPTYAQRDSPTYEPYEQEHRYDCMETWGLGELSLENGNTSVEGWGMGVCMYESKEKRGA